MNSKVALTVTASVAAALLAACGGGGGGGDSTPTPTSASLQLAGTAATGAALAAANVEVKCAAGSASALTGTAGGYSVTIADGALPCMVEVKKTVNGTTVSLHSLVEAGTVDDAQRRTFAIANVTPVTEMIVAHLSAALPEDRFRGFQGEALTPAQLQAASAAIIAALKDAGVDFTGIDPFEASLVAATSTGTGNAHDRLLDALGTKIDDDALKVVVNQIAVAAQANSDDGLKNAMAAVSGGSLQGCPVAVSGKYRTVDLFGTILTHDIDFANMRATTAGTNDVLALTADPSESCVFTATGGYNGVPSTFKFVIGASGVGNFRAAERANTTGNTGLLFPVQPHSYSDLRGTWSALETDLNARSHSAGQVTFGEERKVSTCNYDASWNCVADATTQTAVERSDGGIDIPVSGTEAVRLYGYRAPNGAFALFGATQPTSNIAVLPTTIVATKLAALPVPAVGTTTRSWDGGVTVTPDSTFIGTDPAPISYTITAADATAGTATRRNDATGRIETLRFNQPLAGVRTRDAGTFNGSSFAQLVQIPLAGMGVTLSINAVPFGAGSSFIHNIAVVKP